MKTAIEHYETIESHINDEWSTPMWEFEEAMDEMRRIAERATVKRPTEVTDPHGYVCPECGRRLRRGDGFCPKCGQGLEW